MKPTAEPDAVHLVFSGETFEAVEELVVELCLVACAAEVAPASSRRCLGASSEQSHDDRDPDGTPSRSDLLAHVIMPLMDRLAEDYEADTLAVPGEFEWRVLIQTSSFVERVLLWTYHSGRSRCSHRSA